MRGRYHRLMSTPHDAIDDRLRDFIERQHVFFVATAPLAADGHVNVSPKGLEPLRILGPRTIAYLDHVGSGAETIAHLRENGRIVVMLCAFDGPPKIVRIHGRGRVLEPQDPEYAAVLKRLESEPPGRSIIYIDVDRVSDSCGFGVPLLTFVSDRSQLPDWAARKGEEGRRDYQATKNRASIDGLPALRWPTQR